MTTKTLPDPTVLTTLAGMNAWFLEQNLAGISHQESLRSPEPGGNPLNWVLGHLVYWRRSMLEILGRETVGPSHGWECYDAHAEGARPWSAGDAHRLEELHDAFRESQDLLADVFTADDAGERLVAAHGDATAYDRLVKLLTHESYHVGQTGLLRRLLGHEGAV